MKKQEFNDDFDKAFSSYNTGQFEDWFCTMGEFVWGSDFENLKAGGTKGDKKCDGRLVSKERVYQCYAPESAATFAKNAASKAQDSFPKVTEYWPNLKEWVFVHNNDAGIPVSLSDKLEELRKSYPAIKISAVSRNYLKTELHDKLTLNQLVDLYPGSSVHKFGEVQMQHIKPLLRDLIKNADSDPDPHYFGPEPDEAKLDHNQLSNITKRDIRLALTKARLVDRFLNSSSSPNANAILQTEMMEKYKEFKGFSYSPDEIVGQMVQWVCNDPTPTTRSAAEVIVAYYFDACDIFEEVPASNP